jgi:hypothetical protein
METRSTDRTRAAFGLAVLAGVVVMLVSASLLLPLLSSPLGFAAAGAVGASPTLIFLAPRIGAKRAALLAAAVAVAMAIGFLILGFAAWLLAG